MIYRILGSLVVFLSIMLLPYWIYIPILLVTIILFTFFWEGLLLVLLVVIIYSNGGGFLSLVFSPLVISVLVLLIALVPIRDKLRFQLSP